jgi:hypothetical protein
MLAGVVVLAMLAAGCGSDSDGETTALTKKQFISQANAICIKHNKKTANAYDGFFRRKKPASASEVTQFANRVYYANLERRVQELEELVPPAADEDEVAALIETQKKGIEKAKAEKAVPFQSTFAAFQKANKRAEKYGVAYCIAV